MLPGADFQARFDGKKPALLHCMLSVTLRKSLLGWHCYAAAK